jgi:uncharacterized membrane protein
MSTPASIAKHPIHPMLVAFPIGLLVFSFACDLVYFFGTRTPVWSRVALYTMAGGILGGVVAALPGLIDFLSIRDPKTKNVAWKHMLANLSGLVLFAAAFWLHHRYGAPSTGSLGLSLLGMVALGIGGWLGGELVYVHGMGVDLAERSKTEQRSEGASARETPEVRMRRAG